MKYMLRKTDQKVINFTHFLLKNKQNVLNYYILRKKKKLKNI